MPTIYTKDKDKLPKKKEHEFYPTPAWACELGLSYLPKMQPKYILDPGAGDGAWGKAARTMKGWRPAEITGVELREVARPTYYDHWIRGTDFRMFSAEPIFSLVIGNPPFSLAEAFVLQSLKMLKLDGYLLFLLPLYLLAGKHRARKLYQRYPPRRVVICHRISFYGGGSNADDYAFVIWQKGHYDGDTQLSWWEG